MATPTQYYVDPVSGNNGNAGTSDGAAWLTLKYAIETGITPDTTNGDQINLKSSGADVYSSGDPAIDISLYAASGTATAPLIIRGYTSTANDGGRGAITCTGRYLMNLNTFDHCKLIDLDITGGSTVGILQLDQYTDIINCTITQTSSGHNVQVGGAGSKIVHSAFLGCGATKALFQCSGSDGYVCFNVFKETTNDCYGVQGSRVFIGNVVHIKGTANPNSYGYYTASDLFICMHNTLINTAAGIVGGIQGSGTMSIVLNNYIEGWSGVGGKAISLTGSNTQILAGNRWYNCTSGITSTDANFDYDNSSLGSSGLTNPGASDYTPVAALRAAGFPTSHYSIGDATNLNIGAIMSAATGGMLSHPGMAGRLNG